MAQEGLAIRRPIAALLTAAVLAVGILFGVGVTAWAGHPAFGTQKMSPTIVSGTKGQPAENASSGMGYASILKPALSAVVNISSSKIVKALGGAGPFGPFFNDPFFRQFFGDQFFHGNQMPREQSLGSGVVVSPDGYVLTNNHVIEGATEIKIRLFAVTTSYASGNAGGIFEPSLFIGAMLGGTVGTLAHHLFPAYTATPGAYALVGMGAVFAGIVRAPMTSVLMIFEMTQDYA